MARFYATTSVEMLNDDDWRALSVGAKAVYELLRTQPDIQACGVLPLTMRRWARALNDDDRPHLARWLNELGDARFVIIDKDTEELLVRSFAKWDGGYKNANRRASVVASANTVHSPLLRSSLQTELGKLGLTVCGPDADPTPSGPRRNPAPPVDNPPKHPSEPGWNPVSTPSEPGSNGVPARSEGPLDPSGLWLRNVTTSHTPSTLNERGEPAASQTRTPPPPNPEPPTTTTQALPDPWCPQHPGGTEQPCRPCGQARETAARARALADAADLDAKATARRARANCPHCHGTGWTETPTGQPAGKCTHPTPTKEAS